VNTLTNVQWFVLPTTIVFIAAWLNGYRPPFALTCFLLAVAVLTSPLICVLLPVVGLVAIVRRQRYDMWLALVLLAGTLIQVLARLTAHSGNHPETLHPGQFLRFYTIRVVDGSFLGSRLVYAFYRAMSPAGAMIVGSALAALLIVSSYRKQRQGRWVYVFLLVTPIVLLAVTLILRSELAQLPNAGFVSGLTLGGRYMVGPATAVFLAAVLCLQQAHHRSSHASVRALTEVAAGLLAVLVLMNYPIDLVRVPYSSWTAQARQQRAACRVHGNIGTVRLWNAPGPAWSAVMTCRQAFG
jgi:hypothetical protein